MALTHDLAEVRSIKIGLINGETIRINGDDWILEEVWVGGTPVLRVMDHGEVLTGATIPWEKITYVLLDDKAVAQ